MWLESVPGSKDHAEKCPTCGGAVRRRKHRAMHAGSFVLDGKRVEIRRVPDPEHIDPIVLDPLTQYFDGGLYRLWPSETYYSRGGKKLHRDVWESAFGPIPRGCHIHHRDTNPANNALDNLECLPSSEHLSITWKYRPISQKTRDAAAEWHRSEAGRLWHRRHAKRQKSWTKWKREDRPCDFCGKVFKALIRKSGWSQRFCSLLCKAADYRRRNTTD